MEGISKSKGLKANKRGYLYTIAIIMIIMPLILLIVFYSGVMPTKIEDTSGSIRCDELYYFVQDIENDLDRALLIFGRRAAIYAVDDVISNNRTMENYTYHNCSEYVHDGEGAEAAMAELIVCGTLYGNNITYMVNHTLPTWIERIEEDGKEMNFNLDFKINSLRVIPHDAFNFAIILDLDISVSDKTGLCYYVGSNYEISSLSNIEGLEDPLVPLNTRNLMTKYIYNCSSNINLDSLAGCSTENWGNDTGSGNVVFYSNIKDDPGLGAYCSTTSEIGEQILAIDFAFGSCTQLELECFDINSPNHFAGVIEYAKNNPDSSFVDKCNITIPWISATGKIDNETAQGQGHQRNPDCADGDINTGTCVMIRNIPSCLIHQVLIGYSSDNLNVSCYAASNASLFDGSCPGENYLDGPSFFDRLEGRLNLSERYTQMAYDEFGNEHIGLETLISPYELEDNGIQPNTANTWIDYLYWANKTGCIIQGTCAGGKYDFRLDCQHAYVYGLDTDCVNASGVEPFPVIMNPSNDTMFSCVPININGSAADCDGSVEEILLRINGVEYETHWDDPWWNYTWTPEETGMYAITPYAIDNDGITGSGVSTLVFVSGCPDGDNIPPSSPGLLSPEDAEEDVDRNPTFYWSASSDASGIYRYEIEVDDTSDAFENLVQNDYSWTTEYYQSSELQNNKWHWWRVRAQDNAGNWGEWDDTRTFKT